MSDGGTRLPGMAGNGAARPPALEEILAHLRPHLAHHREVLDGWDFLFAGPFDTLRPLLRDLVFRCEREHGVRGADFAFLGSHFLLRVYTESALTPRCLEILLSGWKASIDEGPVDKNPGIP